VAEVGVVLKVPQPTHTRFKEACAKHDRSMQKVLLSLIEGWVANGAPDPSAYGRQSDVSQGRSTQDLKARQAIIDLASDLNKLQDRLDSLEKSVKPAPVARFNLAAFEDALLQAAGEKAASDIDVLTS
jgi:hypothetical protein